MQIKAGGSVGQIWKNYLVVFLSVTWRKKVLVKSHETGIKEICSLLS